MGERLNEGSYRVLRGSYAGQEDDREGYGELRLQCFAPMGARLYCVVLTEDKDQYRIISLREATNREKRCYMDHI